MEVTYYITKDCCESFFSTNRENLPLIIPYSKLIILFFCSGFQLYSERNDVKAMLLL